MERRTVDIGRVRLEGDEDIGGRDTVLVRELFDDRVLVQWRVVGAERGVCGDDNAILRASLENIGLQT